MKREANGPALSAIFVDYDNIYLSLKRRNEDAAKRFSKDAALWLKELETGSLITSTSGFGHAGQRRIVLNRCYGNPVPRRNSHDNSTDMNSFPFIRHHFLRSGAEVVDCPPLTAQLKNSADIRIVMDVRDMITHDTYFDEFIILSSDADFTPLLHRLRAHARRTVIYANDQTASPYTAISDGEVREADLLRLLLEGRERAVTADAAPAQLPQPQMDLATLRRELAAEAANLVRAAGQPVPLEALADRLVRQFGHDRTSGNGWAQMGGFLDLLANYLPEGLKISDQPPYVVFELPSHAEAAPTASAPIEAPRHAPAIPPPAVGHAATMAQPQAIDRAGQGHGHGYALQPTIPAPVGPAPLAHPMAIVAAPQPVAIAPPAQAQPDRMQGHGQPNPQGHNAGYAQGAAHPQAGAQQAFHQPPAQPRAPSPQQGQSNSAGQGNGATPRQGAHPAGAAEPAPQAARPTTSAAAVQQMVARIYDACQAPPLSPPEYRLVFDIIARELAQRGLNGVQTLDTIAAQAKGHGVEMRRDDVRFILDVVSETDPWFEQGVSPTLFASRFRNFVVARCRSQGLALSAEEIDLIDHWFAGADIRATQQAPRAQHQLPPPGPALQGPGHAAQGQAVSNGHPNSGHPGQQGGGPAARDTWWSSEGAPAAPQESGDDFPRIIRSRVRG